MAGKDYVWTRRERESSPAYAAFQVYLHQGGDRSLAKVSKEVGKSWQLITKWSSDWSWVERSRSFDVHLSEAKTDGLIHQVAASRDKNLALMDKLRDHLSNRLDYFIRMNDDPSIRWTQALTAMAKVEANSLLMGKEEKTTEQVTRVEEMLEKMEQEILRQVEGT